LYFDRDFGRLSLKKNIMEATRRWLQALTSINYALENEHAAGEESFTELERMQHLCLEDAGWIPRPQA
jgi:hypothetical protein